MFSNYILVFEIMIQSSVYRLNRVPNLLSSQTRPDDDAETTVAHACAFADQNATTLRNSWHACLLFALAPQS
jgi:hypothetical protein